MEAGSRLAKHGATKQKQAIKATDSSLLGEDPQLKALTSAIAKAEAASAEATRAADKILSATAVAATSAPAAAKVHTSSPSPAHTETTAKTAASPQTASPQTASPQPANMASSAVAKRGSSKAVAKRGSSKQPLGPAFGTLPYRSFDCDLSQARAQLEDIGVAVIPNVLKEADLEKMREGMWTMMGRVSEGLPKGLPQITRDPATWDTLKAIGQSDGMIISTFRLGQAQVAWDVRQHPAVCEAFATVWRCKPEELLTSVDSIFAQFPPETAAPYKFYNGTDWFHRDQRMARNDRLTCVQGSVSAFDVAPGDACFTCYPGSQKLTNELIELVDEKEESKLDWVRMNDRQLAFLDERCGRFNVQCSAGSLILWDSRTVHCGCLPQRGRPNPTHMRFVIPVCQMPRSSFWDHLPKAIEKKVEVVMGDQRVTTHWPDARRLFPVIPFRQPGDRDVKFHLGTGFRLPDPVLTPLGYTLAGFDQTIANKATSLQHALALYRQAHPGKPKAKRATTSKYTGKSKAARTTAADAADAAAAADAATAADAAAAAAAAAADNDDEDDDGEDDDESEGSETDADAD